MPGEPGDIVVNGYGGYWTFEPTGRSFGDLSHFPTQGSGGESAIPDFHGLSATGESVTPFLGYSHMAAGTIRHLTQAEKIAVAGYTNLTDAELNAVVIRCGGEWPGAAATTYPWSINMNSSYALKDYSSNPDTLHLLVHDLYHVYQYDSGFRYARMVADEGMANSDIHNYYTYTAGDLATLVQNPNDLDAFNVETQAQIAQDYYHVTHGLSAQGAVGFHPTAAQLESAIHF